MTTPDPIEAVDVTDECKLDEPADYPPEDDTYHYRCVMRTPNGTYWWYTSTRFDSPAGAMTSALQQAFDKDTIRIFRLGGEEKGKTE